MSDAIHPASTEELAAFLEENSRKDHKTILPIGGGTWLDFGRPVSANVHVHTDQLAHVIDYPARDMTVTVEAGVSVAKLDELLAAERQQLPIDVPQRDAATIGGVIAANVSGPRRFGCGTLRDYLIGITAVDAGGRVFHAGGRVVKNVAGYDLCKLMIGSRGTLAVVSQATFKVTPIPEHSAWVWSTWNSAADLDAALADLMTSAARPIAFEVLNSAAAKAIANNTGDDLPIENFALALNVTGSKADTDWQMEKLTEELNSHQPRGVVAVSESSGITLQERLTEFPVSGSGLTFQANLLPSRTMPFIEQAANAGFLVQARAGNGIVIGRTENASIAMDDAKTRIKKLRELAESNGSRLVIQSCPDDWKSALDVFGTLPASWALMKKLKQSLDPQNLLSPNRLFAAERA